MMETEERNNHVFINCSYSKEHDYILQGIMFSCMALGLDTYVVKMDKLDQIRITNIEKCIKESWISIHDLTLMGKEHRYNMTLEAGMAIMHASSVTRNRQHHVILLESTTGQVKKYCSDLDAYDPISYSANDQESLVKRICEAIINIIGQPENLTPQCIFDWYLDFLLLLKSKKNISWNEQRQLMKDFISRMEQIPQVVG